MKDYIKVLLRKILIYLHLDITRNLKYDRLTEKIIAKTITSLSNCIDIGAHKGEILDLFLKYAPNGNHFAFEPIPLLYENLKKKYAERCFVSSTALGNYTGKTTFQFVKNAPAFSGIKKRKYVIKNPEIEEIEVQIGTLDSILDKHKKIDFIKIDVEGAELAVLEGGKGIIDACKPYILFESGVGGSDYYGTTPELVFDFFAGVELKISTLKDWLRDEKKSLSKRQFCDHFNQNTEYYFLAHT